MRLDGPGVRTMGQVKLAPTSQSLAEVGVDLMYAGLELDPAQGGPAPGGIDLTVRCAFGERAPDGSSRRPARREQAPDGPGQRMARTARL